MVEDRRQPIMNHPVAQIFVAYRTFKNPIMSHPVGLDRFKKFTV